jgi:hypothetical protein
MPYLEEKWFVQNATQMNGLLQTLEGRSRQTLLGVEEYAEHADQGLQRTSIFTMSLGESNHWHRNW